MDRIEVKFASEDMDAKTGEFSGYGAIFGNEDLVGDLILPGAFRQSLKDWKKVKKLPSMLFQHGSWMRDMEGLPIGVWTEMEEDDKGLKVKGRLINLDTDRGKAIYGAMREGVLDGLSIGYRARKFTYGTKPTEPPRTLEQVDLTEVSVVTFPANPVARIEAVKTARGIKTIRDFEDFLRDAGGFSNAAAKAIASRGFKAADPRDEDGADLAALLRRNIAILT